MKNFNSYWPIYKNLEEETLKLTKYIQFTDEQLNVYSMHIADLIIRIVVEIESISKELYKLNGGPDVFNNDNKIRKLYYDTDCLKYLNNKFGICNRTIIVSCTDFYLINEEHKVIKPLAKAYKNGKNGENWNKAYQAVKHDRRNNLKQGNIENLINALGALYILNIYYKDDIFEYGSLSNPNIFFDNRLDSKIFAASFVDATKVSINNDDSDNAIDDSEKNKLSSALCIIKYKDNEWEKMHKELFEYNNRINNEIIKKKQFTIHINEKKINENNLEKIAKTAFDEIRNDFVRKNPPINLGRTITNGKLEVILNKNQTIYKSKISNNNI